MWNLFRKPKLTVKEIRLVVIRQKVGGREIGGT